MSLRWFKTFWKWAAKRGLAPANIVADIEAETDLGIILAPRDHVYSPDEMKALWNANSDNLTVQERAFVKLAMLLCVRAGALRGMRKSELDSLEKPTLWTVPTERVKATFVRSFPHVLLLEQMAVGSEDPIPFDRAALEARLADPWVRDYFQRVRIDIRRIVLDHLAASEPVRLGPDSDRSAFADVNRDLFPKDEFLVDGVAR